MPRGSLPCDFLIKLLLRDGQITKKEEKRQEATERKENVRNTREMEGEGEINTRQKQGAPKRGRN